MKPDTATWRSKAARDLQIAQVLCTHPETAPWEFVGFLCQQAIEKALKAFLIEADAPFERSHDLVYLVTLCSERDVAFATLTDPVQSLNPYAVRVRYPTDLPLQPTLDDARAFVTLAIRVLAEVDARIVSLGASSGA